MGRRPRVRSLDEVRPKIMAILVLDERATEAALRRAERLGRLG